MEPKIVTKPEFYVVGMSYVGKNEHGEIPQLWEQFNPRCTEVQSTNTQSCYGLCFDDLEGVEAGVFEYIAAAEVSGPDAEVPSGMVLRHLPARKYAVFTHQGTLAKLHETYEYIYQTWLPQSGVQLDGKFDMEVYDEDFDIDSPDSKLYIYVAVK